jgi:signal transduction histidine kinase
VTVALAVSDRSLVITVVDDGRGFDPAAATAAGRRLGLTSMRERARAVGARFGVRSRPGGGTTVRLEVPLP